jgi:hypothetical protein
MLIGSLTGCASVPKPQVPVPEQPPYDAWARVLDRFVDDRGWVAFAALKQDRADLDRFVNYVYRVSPRSHPEQFPSRAHELAYHYNAYNALAMHKVIERGIPETLAGLRKVWFFFFGPVQVGGERMTLAQYENRVIRAYDEPRLHFTLNCMSVGCPRLPREPFLPDVLTQQMERETRFFFSEARNLRVDHEARTVHVSEILDFYTEDFLAHAPSLIAYINRYVEVSIPEDYQVRFIDYDWTIVRQPGDRA